MMMRKMKKLPFLVLTLILVLAVTVFAEERVDRYDQIFDASQDAGRLTARFLQLTTRSDDKSGDSTILTSPDGKAMIVDAGNPSTFIDIQNALDSLGITRIDYLVASHPHVDHVGSFAQLIYGYDIGAVYTTEVEYPTSHYRNYMEALEATETPHVILAEGDTFMFGDHVLVEVFHPAPGIEYYEGYPEGSTHHGAGTSSSRPFRDAVGAEVAVMMSDAIEELRIYRNYANAGTDTYITSIDGSVLVSTVGDGSYTVIPQFDRVGDFLN